MKFIIALVLAVPTYGVSILILFAYMFYKTKNLKTNMEKAIVYLSNDNHFQGTCFDEISYTQAIGYASETGQITDQVGLYIEFKVEINEKKYEVTLNREPNRDGAILNAKNIDWIEAVYSWLFRNMNSRNLPDISKILSLTKVKVGSAAWPEHYKCDIKEIPKDLCRIKSLEELHFQFNQLKELPEEIGNLENLKWLKIGGNKLETLPPTIGKLKNLQVLTVWQNNLVEIPPEIGLLSNLKGLSFWGNPLASLPEEITKLTQLKVLEINIMPNLCLSPNQKVWIKNLTENGCTIYIDDNDDQIE